MSLTSTGTHPALTSAATLTALANAAGAAAARSPEAKSTAADDALEAAQKEREAKILAECFANFCEAAPLTCGHPSRAHSV